MNADMAPAFLLLMRNRGCSRDVVRPGRPRLAPGGRTLRSCTTAATEPVRGGIRGEGRVVEIKDKKAVIVGGASGMAKASAELLHAKGAAIAILDLPTSKGAEVAKALGGTFH